MAVGRRLREQIPRASLAGFSTSSDRPDPVAILEAQAVNRLPNLVPIRYARMLTSPFAYLRGSAAVMAMDLAKSPTTGLTVQACGDAHVANFGVFGSAERNLIFGINDFDETLPGPWEWDLKRLAASAVVAGRFLGGADAENRAIARAIVRSYRKRIRQFSKMGNLELFYARIGEHCFTKAFPEKMREGIRQFTAKAKRRTHLQVLEKMTDLIDDQKRIVENRPFIVRETHSEEGMPIQESIENFLHSYLPSLSDNRRHLLKRYRIHDVARKVVGVGSVGTRCWVIFLHGSTDGDPLFLQLKQATPSVLEPYTAPSAYSHQGQRVVAGQQLIQGAPDIFLGWGVGEKYHYYVRQLRDMKGSAEFMPNIAEDGKLPRFKLYCQLCGWALALAHAKSGDSAIISGYAGKSEELDDAIEQFAVAYADQNDRDYQLLKSAAAEGRVAVANHE